MLLLVLSLAQFYCLKTITSWFENELEHVLLWKCASPINLSLSSCRSTPLNIACSCLFINFSSSLMWLRLCCCQGTYINCCVSLSLSSIFIIWFYNFLQLKEIFLENAEIWIEPDKLWNENILHHSSSCDRFAGLWGRDWGSAYCPKSTWTPTKFAVHMKTSFLTTKNDNQKGISCVPAVDFLFLRLGTIKPSVVLLLWRLNWWSSKDFTYIDWQYCYHQLNKWRTFDEYLFGTYIEN